MLETLITFHAVFFFTHILLFPESAGEVNASLVSPLQEPPNSGRQSGKGSSGKEGKGRCYEDGLANYRQIQHQEEGWAKQPDFWQVSSFIVDACSRLQRHWLGI